MANSKLNIQSTTFPHNGFMMCKTCEKQIFFVRKLNTDSDLGYVEKKSPKSGLICFVIAQ